MKELFSESTILLSIFKGSQLKSKITNFISDNDYLNISATYCILEYLNIIMTQTEYLIKKIKKFKSLDKALEFINNVLTQHKQSYKLWTFNLLRKNYGINDDECTEKAILSLETLRITCLSILKNYYSKLTNSLNCNLYKDNLGILQGEVIWNKPKCKINNKKCKIKNFFIENKEIVIKIKNIIDNLDESKLTKELIEFSQVIDIALNNPEILYDYKNGCNKLADVLIALESKDTKDFFTQNSKESKILCSILKQKLYILSNNFDKEIEVINFS